MENEAVLFDKILERLIQKISELDKEKKELLDEISKLTKINEYLREELTKSLGMPNEF